MTTPLYPREKGKPALDETGFQQLLAAAYVLQQHNDSVRARHPRLDTQWVVSQVAEVQSLLRAGSLRSEGAAKLIAERLQAMTESAGVSISLTGKGYLYGVAESGVAARVPGGSIASHSLVATELLSSGKVFQSAEAHRDIRLDMPACRELGVRALLAVPVRRSGEVAGLVEVRWTEPDAFHECDVRTCQLMAALVGDVLEREGARESRIIPPASSLFSVSNLESDLESDEAPLKTPNSGAPLLPPPAAPVAEADPPQDTPSGSDNPSEVLAVQCRVCGRPFIANESFCGNCGMPRVAGAPAEGLQSKWASLWYIQQAREVSEEQESPRQSQTGTIDLQSQGDQRTTLQAPVESVWRHPEMGLESPPPGQGDAGLPPPLEDVIATPSWDDAIRIAWKRAQQAVGRRMNRRSALLAAASLALLFMLVVWGSLPAPASPPLTRFESLLVKLGLAQLPPRGPTVPTGNPDVRVWVDVHTALYYCPGSDLYGKTPGGQFATQHDARQDQFEPATGAVCE